MILRNCCTLCNWSDRDRAASKNLLHYCATVRTEINPDRRTCCNLYNSTDGNQPESNQMHSAHSTEENQTESNQLHFVQLYERKPDRI